jgi:hypothetical protein
VVHVVAADAEDVAAGARYGREQAHDAGVEHGGGGRVGGERAHGGEHGRPGLDQREHVGRLRGEGAGGRRREVQHAAIVEHRAGARPALAIGECDQLGAHGARSHCLPGQGSATAPRWQVAAERPRLGA